MDLGCLHHVILFHRLARVVRRKRIASVAQKERSIPAFAARRLGCRSFHVRFVRGHGSIRSYLSSCEVTLVVSKNVALWSKSVNVVSPR